MREPIKGIPIAQRHLQRVQGQLRAHVTGNRPTYDSPREQVDNHRQVKPSFPSPDVRDVGDPDSIGMIHFE